MVSGAMGQMENGKLKPCRVALMKLWESWLDSKVPLDSNSSVIGLHMIDVRREVGVNLC